MLHNLWEKIPPRFIFLGFLLDEFNFLAVDGGQPYTTCKPFKPRIILLFPKYIPFGKIIFLVSSLHYFLPNRSQGVVSIKRCLCLSRATISSPLLALLRPSFSKCGWQVSWFYVSAYLSVCLYCLSVLSV